MADQELETVASVIARLGAPPPDIAEQWMVDARSHLGVLAYDGFDAASPVWQRLVLDESGRARLPRVSVCSGHDLGQQVHDQPSRIAAVAPELMSMPDVGPVEESTQSPATLLDRGPRPREIDSLRLRDPAVRRRRIAKALVAAGFLTVVAVSATVLLMSSSPPADETVETVASKSPGRHRDVFSPAPIKDPEGVSRSARSRGALSRPTQTPHASSSQAILETMTGPLDAIHPLDSNADSESTTSEPRVTPDLLSTTLSLDAYLPATMTQSDQASTPESALADSTPVEVTEHAVEITDLPDEGEPVEQAVPQPTSASDPPEPQTTAVTLPSPPATIDAELPPAATVLAVAASPSQLHLEFPSETPLRLQAGPNGWHVTAGEEALPIGIFEMRPSAEKASQLQFRWLSAAADTPLAESLIHGRITTSDGDIVYLRAQLHARTILMGLGERDAKLKWMLGGPLLTTPTRLRLKLEVPDDVGVTWIEPIDENSPQRTRGIAVVTLKDAADSGALALRIDIQGSAAFSMRLRYGARLGPGMPWQWTDAKLIQASLDATTQQLEIADDQLLQMETAIARAKKIRARRQELALEIQRDGIEEAVRSATLVAKRLAELDQLVALLNADGRITLNLHVHWPGGEMQPLLSLDEN